MTTEEFRQRLIEKSFRIYPSNMYSDNRAKWYAGRSGIETRHQCETNEKDQQIVIYPYEYGGGDRTSCECKMTGELHGRWFQLNCYSMTYEQAIENIDAIQAELLAAWEAIGDCKTKTTQPETA